MSLSVASNAAGYGKPLGYGLVGLSAISLGGDAPQRSSAAPSWSWTPPSTGSVSRDPRLSNLMAVLSRFTSPDPDATAPSRGRGIGASGSSSSTGPAQSVAVGRMQALNDSGAARSSPAPSASEGDPSELDPRPLQDLAQASTSATPALTPGPSAQDASEDPSVSKADAQLEALFKTLQAYGL